MWINGVSLSTPITHLKFYSYEEEFKDQQGVKRCLHVELPEIVAE